MQAAAAAGHLCTSMDSYDLRGAWRVAICAAACGACARRWRQLWWHRRHGKTALAWSVSLAMPHPLQCCVCNNVCRECAAWQPRACSMALARGGLRRTATPFQVLRMMRCHVASPRAANVKAAAAAGRLRASMDSYDLRGAWRFAICAAACGACARRWRQLWWARRRGKTALAWQVLLAMPHPLHCCVCNNVCRECAAWQPRACSMALCGLRDTTAGRNSCLRDDMSRRHEPPT